MSDRAPRGAEPGHGVNEGTAGSGTGTRTLAQLAHDLRTPLNSIQAWTYVLEAQLGKTDPLVRRALEGIRLGVEQQSAQIDALSSDEPDGSPPEAP